ncbi:ATP synthase subunit I [Sporosarcina gallistercoris]|uniref:ATP synthase subunit I n=1 Tax=Sporosarcina gallistercoris TaxID=2762245 RepID=A0ABR8PLX5_9BACL|nr:ATP synthase subunit I [Sporosarcina gallistercoris]MBD7909171.1 ATP synthase subunit I [Sporosarcina gallistercoris]
MQTMQEIFTRQKRALFFLLALLILGWAFTGAKEIFAGLLLGLIFGLYNFWILIRRMEQFDKKLDQGKKVSLGSGLRFASGVAAAAIAMSMPEYFNLISTVIGLMIPYALLLIDRIFYHVKHHS